MKQIFLHTIITILFCASFAHSQNYQLTNPGTLGGDYSDADGGINNAGQTAGVSKTASGEYHAYFYDAVTGLRYDIGTFGGDFSRPNAINENALVVGRATLANDNSQAFLYNGVTRVLTNLHSSVTFGGAKSSALSVNNNGQIVGWAEDTNGKTRAFYYNPATNQLVDLQSVLTLPNIALSIAYDINDAGKIVGAVENTDGFLRTVVWTCNAGGCTANTNFPAITGNNSPSAINNGGIIIGDRDTANQNDNLGYIYVNETLRNAVFGSCCGNPNNAKNLNNNGEIVGAYYNSTLGSYRAFLSNNAASTTSDLNSLITAPGWNLLDAAGISDNGRIAGTGQTGGESRAYILTPNNFTTYTISGHIRHTDNSPVSGVTVALSGSASSATTTDSSGNYSFTVPAGGNFTITPTLAGNTFSPVNATVTNISANQTADFTAALITYTISGTIQTGGAGLADATVKLSGTQTAATTTDSNGNYSLTVGASGDYTVTPSKNGYVFSPQKRAFTNLQTSQTANFGATQIAQGTAWWNGENNANDSIGASHGTLIGNTTFAAGKIGQTFSFDGTNDWVEVPNSPVVSRSANAPLTVNLWAYRNDAQDEVHLFGKRSGCDGDNINYQMGIHTGVGLNFFFGAPGAYAGSTNSIPVAQWTMVTGTFDGTTFRLYKNGVLLASANGSMGAESSAPFKIGSTGACDPRGWRGRLDEVRVFDRALSQSEIQNIYNAESTTFTISGQITRGGSGLANVSVALSGSSSSSTTTDGSGNYSFTVLGGESYTVTPTLANNTFTPASRTFNLVSQNQTANFTASLITYTISGNVRSEGANLQGATVALTGGQSASTTTDANGNYSFTVPAGANYAVSVYKKGIVFNPASQSFTNLNANQTANFQNGVPLCVPQSSGLAAWYKGENNAFDNSGNNNNGGLNGGVGFAAGKVGQAFNFDGIDDRVVIPDSLSTRPTNALTLDVWVKPAQVNQYVQFVSKFDSGNSQKTYYFGTDITGSKVQFTIYNSAGNARRIVTDNSVLTANVLTHLTAVFDASTQAMKIYVNGAEVPASLIESNTVSSIFNGSSPTFLGTRVENSNYVEFFKGLLDEVQIYNRVLSASEIAAIHNAGSTGVCTAAQLPAANGKIVFDSDRSGTRQIYSMNADGSNQTRLTNNSNGDYVAEYSFDGSKIVFTRYTVSTGTYDIFTMNADGSNQVNVTNDGNFDSQPSFSPDGGKIVYNSLQNGNLDIFIMNADGTNRTKMTSGAGANRFPTWSPDGSKIVFTSSRNSSGGYYEVFIMNADGNNQTRLTVTSASHEHTAFSPDGSKIVFESNRDGNNEIYVMNADGTNQTRLTNNNTLDYSAAFSPDGRKIIFISQRDGNEQVYVMNADGTNQTRVTTNTATDAEPHWQAVRFSTLTSVGTNINITPASNVNLTFSNVSQAGNTVATPLTSAQVPALPNGLSFFGGAPIYDIRTSAQYSGNITVRFNVPNVSSASVCNELRMIHFENGSWTTAVNAAPVYNSATQVCALSQTVTSLSPFAVIQLAPLAADVSVSGRVLTANGRGITNTTVTITDANGATRSTLTGSFGFYNFDNVRAGETYIVQVRSKSFSFDQPAQVISAQENVGELDFIANESR